VDSKIAQIPELKTENCVSSGYDEFFGVLWIREWKKLIAGENWFVDI
jgi:hypothetical protein